MGPSKVQKRLTPIYNRIKNLLPKQTEAKSTTARSSTPPKVIFFCNDCPKTFSLKKNLLSHKRQFHGQFITKYKCPICASELGRSYDLKNHFQDVHGIHNNLAEMNEYASRIRKTKKGYLIY